LLFLFVHQYFIALFSLICSINASESRKQHLGLVVFDRVLACYLLATPAKEVLHGRFFISSFFTSFSFLLSLCLSVCLLLLLLLFIPLLNISSFPGTIVRAAQE
jgi:hypothetical protein